MYIVYSDNESQKKFLQEQFLYQSGCFAVPLNNVKSLQDLIGRTCFEFYQQNESIFIEKLKAFITELIGLTFSFPLLRELLTISKKKDLISQFYRSHFVAMNNIFCQGEGECSMFGNEDCDRSNMLIVEELQQTILSYKTLETFEMDNDPFITLQSLAESSQLGVPKDYLLFRNQKASILHSEKTADETEEQYYQLNHAKKKSQCSQSDKSIMASGSSFMLQKCFQNNILSMLDKNIDKHRYINEKMDQSVEEFINSFKKQKGNRIVEMIINEESLGKIARKEYKQRHERKKLEEELYEKTKSQKSTDYNRNIKTIILNKKLKEKRAKPKSEKELREYTPERNMKKKKLSHVLSAGELRKGIFDVVQCPEEGQISFVIPIEK